MLNSFYEAFVEELNKVAGKEPAATFDEWRKHFEATGRKSMVKKPPARDVILGKKADIVKRVPPTTAPSSGFSLDWFGDPNTRTKMRTKSKIKIPLVGRRA